MKAMILAAGHGSRLHPLTIDRTKPAIPFLGRPLVGYVAEYLKGQGIDEVVVNLHHQPDSVRKALQRETDLGIKIEFIAETPEILGTGGAIVNARKLLVDQPFVVINGKIITDINLMAAVRAHRESGAIATMVLRHNESRENFSEVIVRDDRVVGFGNFPHSFKNGSPPLMFTGIQILEPEVFRYLPESGASEIIPSFYKPAIGSNRNIHAHVAAGRWFELSTLERYLEISLAMMAGEKNSVGVNCNISRDASVNNSILWNSVTVEAGARLNRVVVGDRVQIPADSRYENSVIVRADLVRETDIPEKATRGRFEDANYIVSLFQ